MKSRANGGFKGHVGTHAFETTSVDFVADDQSQDFVVEARWVASDGLQRALTIYIPERGPERQKYTYGSDGEYQASAHYAIDGRPNSWQGGYVVREKADFSSSDPEKWRVELIFGIEVVLTEGAISITGEGEVKGASPWGKAMRERFPS